MVSPRSSLDGHHPLLGGESDQQFLIPTPTGPTFFTFKYTMYWIATLGALVFTGTVWYIVFNADYIFFVWHPFLMSTVLFLLTQGILSLQRTETQQEKSKGVDVHRGVQSLAFLLGLCGFSIIFYNKVIHEKSHFESPHGISGVITVSLLFIQLTAGAVILNFPGVFGGVNQAKAMYKYHRISGYLVLLFAWLTAFGGTQADWTKDQFDHAWVFLLAFGVAWIGIASRIRLNKVKVL